MEKLPVLKQHTPIHEWRNVSEHVGIGDIIYVTKQIESNAFRFQLTYKDFIVEWENQSEEETEYRQKVESDCLRLLEGNKWSEQYIGHAYQGENGLVLFSIYDLTFHVYLDSDVVQKIAKSLGFSVHPILFRGCVRPAENQSVSEHLKEVLNERARYHLKHTSEPVIIENISRFSTFKRVIGKWDVQQPQGQDVH